MKIQINAGGSRKLSHENYGGFKYEDSSVWVSMTEEIEAPDADFNSEQLAKKLQRKVRKLLEAETDAKIKEIKQIGKGAVPFAN